MSTKRKIDILEHSTEINKALSKGILLTTGTMEKANTMVIGWGGIGINWTKPVFTAYIRESRYTREILDQTGEFTVNIPVKEYNQDILAVCGSKSGRDIDKIKECNLTLVEPENVETPGIKEFPMTLECRVLYRQEQELDLMGEDIPDTFYPVESDGKRDKHITYIAEITAAYVIE